MSFAGSQLVWQYYPGQGIQIQWLGTFGRGQRALPRRGLTTPSCARCSTRRSASRRTRAGGIAWEYLFHFDGGAPPWVSGLAQGTAIQRCSRGRGAAARAAPTSTPRAPALGIFRIAAARGRARRHRAPARTTCSTPSRPACTSSTASSRRSSGSRLRRLRQRRRGPRAVRRRRGAGARRAAHLRHRRVVALLSPARRRRPRLPRRRCATSCATCAQRVPDQRRALLHRGRSLHGLPAPAAGADAEVDLRGWPGSPRGSVFTVDKLSTVTLTMLRKRRRGVHALGALRLRPPRLRFPPAHARCGWWCACARSTWRATPAPWPGASRCGHPE